MDLEAFQADPEGYLRGVATFAVQGIVSRYGGQQTQTHARTRATASRGCCRH